MNFLNKLLQRPADQRDIIGDSPDQGDAVSYACLTVAQEARDVARKVYGGAKLIADPLAGAPTIRAGAFAAARDVKGELVQRSAAYVETLDIDEESKRTLLCLFFKIVNSSMKEELKEKVLQKLLSEQFKPFYENPVFQERLLGQLLDCGAEEICRRIDIVEGLMKESLEEADPGHFEQLIRYLSQAKDPRGLANRLFDCFTRKGGAENVALEDLINAVKELAKQLELMDEVAAAPITLEGKKVTISDQRVAIEGRITIAAGERVFEFSKATLTKHDDESSVIELVTSYATAAKFKAAIYLHQDKLSSLGVSASTNVFRGIVRIEL